MSMIGSPSQTIKATCCVLAFAAMLISLPLEVAAQDGDRNGGVKKFGWTTRDYATVVGAALGTLAFAWRLYDGISHFVYIELTVKQDGDFLLVRTMVDNKSGFSKELDNALIVIGPENESVLRTAECLLNEPIPSTNALAAKKVPEGIFAADDGRALVPVKFYYEENLGIADERIGYDAPIDIRKFPKDQAYAVRFFVQPHSRLFSRYHRSTEATFVVQVNKNNKQEQDS